MDGENDSAEGNDLNLNDVTLRIVADSTKNEMVRACVKGDAERVGILLNNCSCYADMRDTNDFRVPPILHIAAVNGHADVVSLLLASGATVDAVDKYGFSALHKASKNDHQDVVDLLIEKGAKVYMKDKDDGQLEIACRNGPVDVVHALINRGCHADERHLYAAYSGRRRDVADCLVQLGVRHSRLTADIHIVCFLGLVDQFNQLIREGADVNERDGEKMTPFLVSSRFGHVKLVERCLECDANREDVDSKNWTAIHHAVVGGYDHIIRILIKEGLSVDPKDGKGRSPLHLACENKHLSVVKVLLENGATVNEIDIYGRTPLYYAKSKRVAEALLQNGANVNAKDSYTRTPLHIICESHDADPRVVETLIQYGAELDARDWRGNIALVNSCTAGHVSIVQTLLEYTLSTDPNTAKMLIEHLEDALVKNSGLLKNMRVVECLLKYGVNLDRVDTREQTQGNTPLVNSLELYVDLMRDFPDLPTPEFLMTDVRLFVFSGCRIDILFNKTFLLCSAYKANRDTLHFLMAAGSGVHFSVPEDLFAEVVKERDWETLRFITELGYTIEEPRLSRLCQECDIPTEKTIRLVVYSPKDLKSLCRLTIRQLLGSTHRKRTQNSEQSKHRKLSNRLRGFMKDIFTARVKSNSNERSVTERAIPLSKIQDLPLPNRMKDYISFVSHWSVP